MPGTKCPICKLEVLENIIKDLPNGVDSYFVSCLLCGKFNISRTAFTMAMQKVFQQNLALGSEITIIREGNYLNYTVKT